MPASVFVRNEPRAAFFPPFPNCGLVRLLCRQLCAVHDWTQHAESLPEGKEEQEKAVGKGRGGEGVGGGGWGREVVLGGR